MTPDERAIMQQHVAYRKDLMDKDFMLVFGPVMDQKAVYGLGIVEVDEEQQVHTFIENDPAIQINTYEFYPIRAIVKG